MKLSRALVFLLVGLGVSVAAGARSFTVMAYNVENLIDADGRAVFDDYKSPRYSKAHVLTKVRNIARVLSRVDDGRGPDVVMFAEIEVDLTPGKAATDYDAVLRKYSGMTIDEMLGAKFDAEIADLPAEALLAKACVDAGLTGYRVVSADETPEPGAKAPQAQKCVIFTRLPVTSVRSLAVPGMRPILEVDVDVDGAPLYLFDNHWKSGASDPAMERLRVKSARVVRDRLNEIFAADPHADVILGGDFNSEYNQTTRYGRTMTHTAMNDVLGSQGDEAALQGKRDLYNLWYDLPAKQRASDTYHGEWGTLVQLVVSRGLFDFRGVQYVDRSLTVAKFPGLNEEVGGNPYRWSFDGPGGAGFSDHFPIFARFVTVSENDPTRYLPVKPALDPEADMPGVEEGPKVDVTKVAMTAADLPAGKNFRSPEFVGKIVRVEGRVGKGQRLTVEFQGDLYDVWSFDARLRTRMREMYHAGEAFRFYGELGLYKGHWQFVVRDEKWLK